MRWSELAAHQPALAAAAHDQLIKPGVVLAGTTRRDGSARISGVEPLIMEGELWLSMMPTSAKAGDLRRDPRILVHSIITGPAPLAEIMIRGTARAQTAADVQRRYAAAVRARLGWQPVPGEFALFAVDITDVTFIGHDAGSNAQHVARWPAGEEYLRPSVTPTSLGPPQPVRRLLAQQARATQTGPADSARPAADADDCCGAVGSDEARVDVEASTRPSATG
jgi:hypothetical protein